MFLRTPEMKEYVEDLDEAVVGYQYHTNHRDCSAGEDRKKRLYIKRAPDGWMFYCHHCGVKGYLRAADKMYRSVPSLDVSDYRAVSSITKELEAGEGDSDVSKWPVEARIWWYSYDLNDEDAKRWCLYYGDRLFMRAGGTWVGRSFASGRNKYVNYKHTGKPAYFYYHDSLTSITVVEDVVSAYKVHKAGYNVLALLGTKASTEELELITRFYEHVNVWLDPDTPGQMGATELFKRVNGLCSVMNVVAPQPKEVSYSRIKELLGA